ncbi:hypothetical protein FVB43_18930 [Erwinia rhapontici]|uniref:hypothetical protein n=1 Tax=Erwinia rhapontici TaxID=55212 RepID=UPI0014383F67|nr:hypothetical protein [Erwinia rhapontici]NKG32105.1 hypothetical protein [Erwinia rhapontici]
MLDNYYTPSEGAEKKQRLLAVQAALEIAKASVGSSNAASLSRVDDDLKAVASGINSLANAIQHALKN